MPVQYRHQVKTDKMEMTRVSLDEYKNKMKNEFNSAIDEILESEMSAYNEQRESKRFNLSSYIRGIYYLTFAKYFNPLAYKMAWRVMKKCQEREVEELENGTLDQRMQLQENNNNPYHHHRSRNQ
jgi:hypothetical protein